MLQGRRAGVDVTYHCSAVLTFCPRLHSRHSRHTLGSVRIPQKNPSHRYYVSFHNTWSLSNCSSAGHEIPRPVALNPKKVQYSLQNGHQQPPSCDRLVQFMQSHVSSKSITMLLSHLCVSYKWFLFFTFHHRTPSMHFSSPPHALWATGAYRGGGWGVNPPPQILKFDKAEPNSQFRGKYIHNCLVFLFHHPS
jgi:hypothetical protein